MHPGRGGIGGLRGGLQQQQLQQPQQLQQQMQQMQRLQQMGQPGGMQQQLGQQMQQDDSGAGPQWLERLHERARQTGDQTLVQRNLAERQQWRQQRQQQYQSAYSQAAGRAAAAASQAAAPVPGAAASPYGGGPGFAKPLSPSPSAPDQAGGGAGGPPTSWKMSIEPMAYGGMIPGYQEGGGFDLLKRLKNLDPYGMKKRELPPIPYPRDLYEDEPPPARARPDFLDGPGLRSSLHMGGWRPEGQAGESPLVRAGLSRPLPPIITDDNIGMMTPEEIEEWDDGSAEVREVKIRAMLNEMDPIRGLPDFSLVPDRSIGNLGGGLDELRDRIRASGAEARQARINTMLGEMDPIRGLPDLSLVPDRSIGNLGLDELRDLIPVAPVPKRGMPLSIDSPMLGRDISPPDTFGLTTPYRFDPTPSGGFPLGFDPTPSGEFPSGMAGPGPWTDTGGRFSEEISGAAGDWRITDQQILQDPQTGQYQVKVTFRLPDGSEVTETGVSTELNVARSMARSKAFGASARYKRDQNRAYGGIIGLAGGGYVPMYAGGGIPGYWGGGFLRGLGKVISKVAPIAMNTVPWLKNLSGVAKAGIGALTQGIGDLSEDKGLDLERMLGGAGRAYALSSGIDRVRKIPGLEDEGLWGSLEKILTDADIGKQAMEQFGNIPVGEALALALSEKAKERGEEKQAQNGDGFAGMVDPMATPGRIMPELGGTDLTGGYANELTYGQNSIDYSRAGGGLISGYRHGGIADELTYGQLPGESWGSTATLPAPSAATPSMDLMPAAPRGVLGSIPAAAPPPPPYTPDPGFLPPAPFLGHQSPLPAIRAAPPPPTYAPIAQQIQDVIPQTVAATPQPATDPVADTPPPPRIDPKTGKPPYYGPLSYGGSQATLMQRIRGYFENTSPEQMSPSFREYYNTQILDKPPSTTGKSNGGFNPLEHTIFTSSGSGHPREQLPEWLWPLKVAEGSAGVDAEQPPTVGPLAERQRLTGTTAKPPSTPPVQPATVPAAVSPADVPSSPKLKMDDPVERAQREAHARAEGRRDDAWRKTLQEMEARGQVTPAVAAPIQQPADVPLPSGGAIGTAVAAPIQQPEVGGFFGAPTPPVIEQIQQQVPQTVAAIPPPTPVPAPQQRESFVPRQLASRGRPGWGGDEEREGGAAGYGEGGGVRGYRSGDRVNPDEEPQRGRASQGSAPTGSTRGSVSSGRRTQAELDADLLAIQRQQAMFGMSGANRRDAYTGSLDPAYVRGMPRYDPKAAIPQLNPASDLYDPELAADVAEAQAADFRQQFEQTGVQGGVEGGWWGSDVILDEHAYGSKVHEARIRDKKWQEEQEEEDKQAATQTGVDPGPGSMTGGEYTAHPYQTTGGTTGSTSGGPSEWGRRARVTPPIRQPISPAPGPSTALATRAGTGAGSGFYGEQRWFDPNAAAPAKRDIGGFNPHELPRTSTDFAAAGDVGGEDLLSRLNAAPAVPVQNYLTPAPVPGAAEGGLVDIDQIPVERLEELVKAAQQIESPGSQQSIERAIEDFGIVAVQQIIKMIQQQGPMAAPDGAIPGYGIGGFLKKLLKVGAFGPTQLLPENIRDPINKARLKLAPIAANFLPIPGAGPLLSAGVGVVAKGIEDKIDADRARDAAADRAPERRGFVEDVPQGPTWGTVPDYGPPGGYSNEMIYGNQDYGNKSWNRGGLINGGGGDAMADDIFVDAEMGMNGERQKIAVSAGEYIVPGDVLAHLGSGNTSEGGEVLDQLVEDVRVQRTGSPEQPVPIDLRDVLPGTYGERYA